MSVSFRPTTMYRQSDQGKARPPPAQKEEASDPPPSRAPVPSWIPDVEDDNPLLSPEEVAEELRPQIKSAFLGGLVIGAGAVATFFAAKWIWGRYFRVTDTAVRLPREVELSELADLVADSTPPA